jgi:hypothetical protein
VEEVAQRDVFGGNKQRSLTLFISVFNIKTRWNSFRKKNVCITSYNSALSSAVVLLDLDVPGEEVNVKLRQGVAIKSLQLMEIASGEAFLFVSTVAHGEWRMPLTQLGSAPSGNDIS